MHELVLCSSIVDAVERRAGDRPVARVRVGRLHHVHPEAFDQSFAVAAMGTVVEDAAAELVLLRPAGHRRLPHADRRHADRRHAGRRSSPPHLLTQTAVGTGGPRTRPGGRPRCAMQAGTLS